MKSRSLASLALGAVIVLGATGCGAITPMATTIEYSAGDGVNVPLPDDAPVDILNALIFKGEDGSDGNFVAALVNKGDSAETVTLDWGTGTAAISVPAGEVVSLGATDSPHLLPNVLEPIGATIPVVFQVGDTEPITQNVQVMSDELEQYAGLAPTPLPEQ